MASASDATPQPQANLFSFKLLEYLKEEKLKEDTEHLRRLLDAEYDNVFLVETTGVTSSTLGKVRQALRKDPWAIERIEEGASEESVAAVDGAEGGAVHSSEGGAPQAGVGRFAQLWMAGFNRQMDAINALLTTSPESTPVPLSPTRRRRLQSLKQFLLTHCPASAPLPPGDGAEDQDNHPGRPVRKGSFGLLLTDCSCVATLQRALSLNNDAPLIDLPLHLPLKGDVIFEGDTGLPAQGDVSLLLNAMRIESSVAKGNIVVKHWVIGKKGAVLVDPRVRSLVKALRIKCQSWTPTLLCGVVGLSTWGDLEETSKLANFMSEEELTVLKEQPLESVVQGCLVNLFLISSALDLPHQEGSKNGTAEFWAAKPTFEASQRQAAADSRESGGKKSATGMVAAESEDMNDIFEALF
jgi:hypothetical protein